MVSGKFSDRRTIVGLIVLILIEALLWVWFGLVGASNAAQERILVVSSQVLQLDSFLGAERLVGPGPGGGAPLGSDYPNWFNILLLALIPSGILVGVAFQRYWRRKKLGK